MLINIMCSQINFFQGQVQQTLVYIINIWSEILNKSQGNFTGLEQKQNCGGIILFKIF